MKRGIVNVKVSQIIVFSDYAITKLFSLEAVRHTKLKTMNMTIYRNIQSIQHIDV